MGSEIDYLSRKEKKKNKEKKKYRRRPLWACFYTIFYEYLTRLGNNLPSLPFVSWLSKIVKK